MPHMRTATKSLTHQARDRHAAGADPNGIALAPPAYGLDVVDQAAAGEGPLQRMPAPVHAPMQPQAPVSLPNRTGLPDTLKTGIESLSGYDLSDVRVHFNSSQPAQLRALTYTQGTDIYVAPGQAKHLPHEAWHVVQQKQRRVQPTMQLKGEQVNDEQGLEHEADVMGTQALQMRRPDQNATGPAAQAATAGQRERELTEASDGSGAAIGVSREKGGLHFLSTRADPQIIQRKYPEGKDFRTEIMTKLQERKVVPTPRVNALTNWTYTTQLFTFSTVEEAVEAAEERAQTPASTETQRQEEQRLKSTKKVHEYERDVVVHEGHLQQGTFRAVERSWEIPGNTYELAEVPTTGRYKFSYHVHPDAHETQWISGAEMYKGRQNGTNQTPLPILAWINKAYPIK